MTRHLSACALAILLTSALPIAARAQTLPPPAPSAQEPGQQPIPPVRPPQPPDSGITALMVEVTISRHQDGKRLSSVPYTLAVVPDDSRASLRVGGQVPIQGMALPPAGSDAKPAAPITYRDIGTNVDVLARSVGGGRYRLAISLEETAVYPPDEAARDAVMSPGSRASGAPAFRSLRTNNAVTLQDGQSIEFLAAADRVTGEVARMSVKLTVVK